MTEYTTVIGLEVHAELKTKTKAFCSCSTAFGSEPNTHVCPVCLGMPGALPVMNKQMVEFALRFALAVNCDIQHYSKFDRKNYYYPDLAKAYQISQFYQPIALGGHVDVNVNGETKRIGITRIHMEEDAGKLVHDPWTGDSLVDFNRSGVPLIEIVSEPDMRSADEVIAYLEKLRLIIQYLGASDCKLQEGSMRADVNLSVREVGAEEFGTRTEMKNLNSFKAIKRAIEGEMERQIDLIEAGEKVVQETRRWDDTKGASYAMRSKEDAQDYRYFPEPDLTPIVISDEWLDEIRSRQPEFRDEKQARYKEQFGLPEYDINIITEDKTLTDLFESCIELGAAAKEVSNWIMGDIMRLLKEKEMEASDIHFSPANLVKMIQMIESGAINRKVAKKVFEAIFDEDVDPEVYVEENGLKTVNDEGALRKVIEEIVANNPKSVEDYKAGKKKAMGFFVGQTMRAMKGKADPAMVNQILKEMLD